MSTSTSIDTQENEVESQTQVVSAVAVNKENILNEIIAAFMQETEMYTQEHEQELRQCIQKEIEAYRKLLNTVPDINYTVLQQIGYVYMYVFHHADAMVDVMIKLLNKHPDFKEMLTKLGAGNNGKTEVISVGGGPGSDIVGLMTMCKLLPNKNKVCVDIYDRETLWCQTWSVVRSQLQNFNTTWLPMDIGDPISNKFVEHSMAFKNARLITMIKFLSAVYADEERKAKRDEQLALLCSHVPSGCFILIIDNHNPNAGATDRFVEWFVKIALSKGFVVVEGNTRFTINHSKIRYKKILDIRPKGDGLSDKDCHYRLLKKK